MHELDVSDGYTKQKIVNTPPAPLGRIFFVLMQSGISWIRHWY